MFFENIQNLIRSQFWSESFPPDMSGLSSQVIYLRGAGGQVSSFELATLVKPQKVIFLINAFFSLIVRFLPPPLMALPLKK